MMGRQIVFLVAFLALATASFTDSRTPYIVTAEFLSTSSIGNEFRRLNDEYYGGTLDGNSYWRELQEAKEKIVADIKKQLTFKDLDKRITVETRYFRSNSAFGTAHNFLRLNIQPPVFNPYEPGVNASYLAGAVAESLNNSPLQASMGIKKDSVYSVAYSSLNVSQEMHSLRVTVEYNSGQNRQYVKDQALRIFNLKTKHQERRLLIPEHSEPSDTWIYFISPPVRQRNDPMPELAFWYQLRMAELLPALNLKQLDLTTDIVSGQPYGLVSPSTIKAQIGIYYAGPITGDPASHLLSAVLAEFNRITSERGLTPIQPGRVTITKPKNLTRQQPLFAARVEINSPFYESEDEFRYDNTSENVNFFVIDAELGNMIPIQEALATSTSHLPLLNEICRTEVQNINGHNLLPVPCTEPNTECKSQPNGRELCECQSQYVAIGNEYCAQKLDPQTPVCTECANNSATCYGDSTTKHGCLCPAFRANAYINPNENCSELYAEVKCLKADMVVCVRPFDFNYDVAFANFEEDLRTNRNGAALFVDRNYQYRACHFNSAPNINCPSGYWSLDLSLSDRSCGLDRKKEPDRVSYSANIAALSSTTGKTVKFSTFCKFDQNAQVTSGVKLVETLTDHIVTISNAQVQFSITSSVGLLQQNSYIPDGTPIKLEFSILADTYKFIKVDNCQISNEHTFSSGDIQQVLEDGCPTSGNDVMNMFNTFRRPSPSITNRVLTTPSQVIATRINGEQPYYWRCEVYVCDDDGENSNCKPSECSRLDGTKYPSYGRKRRSASNKAGGKGTLRFGLLFSPNNDNAIRPQPPPGDGSTPGLAANAAGIDQWGTKELLIVVIGGVFVVLIVAITVIFVARRRA